VLRFILTERYVKLFKFVYDSDNPSIKDVSKYTGFQYLHTLNVLKQFQEEGLIKPVFNQENANHKSEPGNPYIIELTLKGQTAHKLLNMLYRLHIGIDEQKIINQIGGKNGKK
jgi:hypothetical protein